jgi:hypothetical protein
MKTILKIAAATIVLALMIITDIPILPVELVPEAQAILGVRRRTRRRTAVIVSSADSAAVATSQQQAAAAEQQATAANQQAAAAQQQLAAAQASSGVPVGTVAQTLPTGCTKVTVGGNEYQDCGGSFYKAAFQGNNLVYVVVDKPI